MYIIKSGIFPKANISLFLLAYQLCYNGYSVDVLKQDIR